MKTKSIFSFGFVLIICIIILLKERPIKFSSMEWKSFPNNGSCHRYKMMDSLENILLEDENNKEYELREVINLLGEPSFNSVSSNVRNSDEAKIFLIYNLGNNSCLIKGRRYKLYIFFDERKILKSIKKVPN